MKRLILACLLLICGGAFAQQDSEVGTNALIVVGEPAGTPLSGAALEELTEEVAGRMRCPVCQGLSVADSPSDAAVAMKAEVRALLAAGYTPAQTVRYFETSYGEFIRLAPKAEGFNLVVWIAPVAMLLIGAAIIAWRLRGPRAAVAEVPGPASVDEDPDLAVYRERVRQELAAAPPAQGTDA
ncbi:MAG TPA: cytochrome c-type biogenesis protein [Thermoanaerobaculia bacterium]|jgi:cytochrome c-type biogenesis protein CcmH